KPSKYEYSYIPLNSTTDEWVTAATITDDITLVNNTPIGSSNVYEFATPLQVKALRVTLTKQVADGNGVGLWEWEVKRSDAKLDQSAPITPSGVAPTVINGNDGKIIGVTTDMEYRAEAEEHYTAITGTEVNGLTAGKYFVRYAETDSLNASPDKEVVILEGRSEERRVGKE